MNAKQGDRIVVPGMRYSDHDRDGEVVGVQAPDGAPPYWVRWSDTDREGLYYPSADAYVAAAV